MEDDPDFDGPIPHEGPPKRYRDEARREMGGIKAVCYDIFTLGAPHFVFAPHSFPTTEGAKPPRGTGPGPREPSQPNGAGR